MKAQWKGGEVPDYLIEDTPSGQQFYCAHGCDSLEEHLARKRLAERTGDKTWQQRQQ